jgi:hypothetical protein
LLSAATLLSAAKRDMAFDWYVHARFHGLALLVTLLIAVSERLYGVSYKQTRRLMSSPTLSSWTPPLVPTALAFLLIALLIVFMAGNKRLKRTRIRNTTKEAAPRWSTLNEVYHEDNSLALNLVGWNRFDLVNATRFKPFWWDEGGFQINERHTALELFIDECCTTTLASAENNLKKGRAITKKGLFCVSTKFRDPYGELDNRFVDGYGHLSTKYAGAPCTFLWTSAR